MKKYCLFFVSILFCCINSAFAQIVGVEAFLQGTFLEIGITNNGAFGTCTVPPAGYHQNCTCSPGGGVNTLDEVYDWGHDGWAVGTPAFMGGYTSPGTPFEGWSLQANGQVNEAFRDYSCPGLYGCCNSYSLPVGTTLGTLTGSITSYSNVGGKVIGNWGGTAVGGNLQITQETRVDANASWVVVTTHFHNIGITPITDVYYERTCDPDNTSLWPGGTSETRNTIVYQNDWDHRVLVSAYDSGYGFGATGVYDSTNAYLGLGTKDCRAVCTFFDPDSASPRSFPFGSLIPQGTPHDIWNRIPLAPFGGTPSVFYPYTQGTANAADEGFALVFNIGTILPNDSAVISYAYIFNGNSGLDSAFPDPVVNINNGAITSKPVWPYNLKRDTFDACMYPGLDSIPITIPFADDKDWTWSTWTWSPGTALSATTGTKVWAHINSIPGAITYTVIGTDSAKNMYSCNYKTFIFTIKSCHQALNNSPCYGDYLWFGMTGDSIGATYQWSGPNGFTSTLHHPFKNPGLYSDTGTYYVIKTIGGINDTDSTHVVIHEKPVLVVTDNAPMCMNTLDTLNLSVTPLIPGETFLWTGPNGFTSTLQFPVVNPFMPVDTGTYTVYAVTSFGCKDTGQIYADLVAPPDSPVIHSADSIYCQGAVFNPFTATPQPLGSGGTINWYTSLLGGTPSPTPPVYSTAVPGDQYVYASVTNSAGCEGPRAIYHIHIKPMPPGPGISGGLLDYCQFVGTFSPVIVHTTDPSAILEWWDAAGGSLPAGQPVVDLRVSGTFTSYVNQVIDGCAGPRVPVTVTVHPKPNPPGIKSDSICQFFPAGPMTDTLSNAGDLTRWFIGSGDTTGTLTAPVPSTLVPGLQDFFANELSPFGCLSDKSKGTIYVKPKPSAPLTRDTTWCQFTQVSQLTADSVFGGYLRWYIQGTLQPHAPVPYNTLPGDSTYYVSEVMDGCESDSTPLKVTVIYKPVFSILPGNTFVCQFDSVKFAYNGPSLFDPKYLWSIPPDALFVRDGEGGQSNAGDSVIYVRFDSVTENNYVNLHVTDNGGFCFGDTSYRIRIVPQPYGKAATKGDVCQGDTVILALGAKSSSASDFQWFIDNVAMDQTNTVSILAHNSNSGGPFSISWNDSGRHVVQIRSSTAEGCTSLPTEDTVHVHLKPDAGFSYLAKNGTLCLEDSVLFTAHATDYNYSYMWLPDHFFSNVNRRELYGKVELASSTVTLLVTDPFGCSATTSQTLNPGSCCTVSFPTAFTPGVVSKNQFFHPIYSGYHRFHEFRIANRWGQTVFESTNSDMSWNGSFNGVPQDIGVYFYYIKFDCGDKTIEQTGDVTLIR